MLRRGPKVDDDAGQVMRRVPALEMKTAPNENAIRDGTQRSRRMYDPDRPDEEDLPTGLGEG